MSEPAVDAEDVRHVATLARIDLHEEDIARYQSEFVEILEYFARLDAVPSVDVESQNDTVVRSDTIEPSLDQADAMRNATDREDGYFKGPRVG